MIKTNEHNVSFNDLTVDTAGLQALTHAGIKTATEIGVAEVLRKNHHHSRLCEDLLLAVAKDLENKAKRSNPAASMKHKKS